MFLPLTRTGHGLRRTPLKRIASWLLLAALVLRGMIPVGFMPDAAALAKGVFPIAICSNGLEQTILVDEDGAPVKPPPAAHHADAPCLFAAVAALAAPLLLAVLLLAPALPRQADWPARAAPILLLLRPPGTAGARAPPAHA
jgi:hypothetical protein